MDISIIIPVYNVEKYIIRCLDSIYNQEFNGTYEVIVIDDFSSDNSLKILFDYQLNFKNLKIIEHKENRKLSMARQTGIRSATGTYILHVDPDDYLLPGSLQRLFNYIDDSAADVLVFNICIKQNNTIGNGKFQIKEKKNCTNKNSSKKYFFGSVINKLVRKELLENLYYGSTSLNSGEDILYCSELYIKSSTIILVPDTFYVYCINTNSITQSINPIEFEKNRFILINRLISLYDYYNYKNKDFINSVFELIIKDLRINSIKLMIQYKNYPSINREQIENVNLYDNHLENFDFKVLRKFSNGLRYCLKSQGIKKTCFILFTNLIQSIRKI